MSAPSRFPIWIRNAKFEPAYLAFGHFNELVKELKFLSGARGLLEHAALQVLPRIGVFIPVENPHILHGWSQIVESLNPASALLLYTGYYKETMFVGAVIGHDGVRSFVKLFTSDVAARRDVDRALDAGQILRPWFRPAAVKKRTGSLVVYELISHSRVAPDPGTVDAAVLSFTGERLAASKVAVPAYKFIRADLLERINRAGVTPSQAIEQFVLKCDASPVAEVRCHGDLTPWNLFVGRSGELCLVDYERVGVGPPYADLFHLKLQPAALTERIDALAPTIDFVVWKTGARRSEVLGWLRLYLAQQLDRDTGEILDAGRSHRQLTSLLRAKAAMLSAAWGAR